MASRNTGKSSEAQWEAHFSSLGKRAYFYRVVDAAEVRGRTGKIGFVRSAPSDYVLTVDGLTSFAEVKSTENKTSFPFSILRRSQTGPALMITKAGGAYDIYVHELAQDRWYKVPYSFILQWKEMMSKSSIPWLQLQGFLWPINSMT